MAHQPAAPDINESEADFTVSEGGIRFGLVALKGVGRSVINSPGRAEQGWTLLQTLWTLRPHVRP